MNVLEPPEILQKMQDEIETCNLERFKKAVDVHKNYYRSIRDINDEEIDQYIGLAEMWLEMLAEVSQRRFKKNLVNPEIEVTFSYSKDITKDYKNKKVKWKNLHKLANSNFNYSPSKFKEGYRDKTHWIDGNDCLVLDIDDGWTIEEAMKFLQSRDLIALITTTKSHQIAKDKKPACDRFRIFLPLKEPFYGTEEEFSYVMHGVFSYFESKPDKAAKDVSRFYYGNPTGRHVFISGFEQFNLGKFPRKEQRREVTPSWQNNNQKSNHRSSYDKITEWFVKEASEGNRNNTLYKAYMFFKNEGMNDAYTIVSHINSKLPNPLPEQEVKQLCRMK